MDFLLIRPRRALGRPAITSSVLRPMAHLVTIFAALARRKCESNRLPAILISRAGLELDICF